MKDPHVGKGIAKAVLFLCAHMAEKKTTTKRRIDRQGAFNTEFLKNKKKILATQSVCAICGKPIDMTLKGSDPMGPTVDHIVPIDKGGHPSDISNLQLAHRVCNLKKSNKLPSGPSGTAKSNVTVPNNLLPQETDWSLYRAKP